MLQQKSSIIFLLSLLFTSCMYQGEKTPPSAKRSEQVRQIQGLPNNAPVNFKNLYQYILKPKCVSCHSGEEPDGDIDLTNYKVILHHPYYYLVVPGSPEESSLYQSIIFDDMPPDEPFLTEKEKEFMKKWILLNAPQ